jgi:hypothetical protein
MMAESEEEEKDATVLRWCIGPRALAPLQPTEMLLEASGPKQFSEVGRLQYPV